MIEEYNHVKIGLPITLETGRAIKFGEGDIWIPKSQILSVCSAEHGDIELDDSMENLIKNKTVIESIEIPRWLALHKGLEVIDD